MCVSVCVCVCVCVGVRDIGSHLFFSQSHRVLSGSQWNILTTPSSVSSLKT